MTSHGIPELDARGLRRFGLTTGGIVAALFGVALPWLFDGGWPIWPWVMFAVVGGIAIVLPKALNPVYKVWMRCGLLLGRITTPLILGIVFFLVITPVGLFRKLAQRDTLKRRFDDSAQTYRIASRQSSPQDFERPY